MFFAWNVLHVQNTVVGSSCQWNAQSHLSWNLASTHAHNHYSIQILPPFHVPYLLSYLACTKICALWWVKGARMNCLEVTQPGVCMDIDQDWSILPALELLFTPRREQSRVSNSNATEWIKLDLWWTQQTIMFSSLALPPSFLMILESSWFTTTEVD